MRRCIFPFVLISLCAVQAHADCRVQSTATYPHLIELYTSEGCSSCPPADAWLRTLPAARAAALAFHVDYWDELGWRDRFSAAAFTARQQAQARREHSSSVYTPQVVLDGRAWTDWYRNSALPALARSRIALTLAATRSGSALHVHVEGAALEKEVPDSFQTYLALSEDGLSTKVGGGENSGKLLKHDHVVRTWAGPLPWQVAEAGLEIPADADMGRATLVAFTQDRRDGTIAQVVRLPLADCR